MLLSFIKRKGATKKSYVCGDYRRISGIIIYTYRFILNCINYNSNGIMEDDTVVR